MPYYLGVVRMRHGVGPHPDIIELRVRLHIEDPDNDLEEEYLMQSARHIFEASYLSRLDMFAPTISEVLSIGLHPAGPPDDYTPPPDDNIADN